MGILETLTRSVIVLLLAVTPSAAQEGFFVGATVPFNKLSGDLSGLDSGNGGGVHGGFGVNRYLSFIADDFRTKHNVLGGNGSIYLKGITLDAKVNIPVPGSVLEPYVRGGVGRYSVGRTGNMIRGKGTQAGVGLDIVLFPALRFTVGMMSRRIDFDSEPPTKGSVSSLEYGLTFFFL